jgi:Tfp pilus assembly protein PilF
VSNAAMLKKSIAYFENKQYDEGLNDLNKLLDIDPSNSEAYYFKGLCKLKLGNPSEAVLSFEQSIKHNNSKKAVTKSLYEIAKIKIE